MNKIGFKNFRRFQNFNPLEFSGITFLVGRNNSGKSTLVKALLLIIDYLKADNVKSFSFNQNNIEDVNIVTFERALNKKANNSKEEYIEFLLEIDGFRLQITVTGNSENTEVDVLQFTIDEIASGISFIINPKSNFVTISRNSEGDERMPESEKNILIELENKKTELSRSLKAYKQKNSPEYLQLNNEFNQFKKKISELRKNIKSTSTTGQFSLEAQYTSTKLRDILEEAKEYIEENDKQYRKMQNGNNSKKIIESLEAFYNSRRKIEESISSIIDFQWQIENVYLGASLNKQSALFAIRDKNNPLAQVIHEYKQLGIDKDQGSDAYRFVKEWMSDSNFDIGDSFDIDMHAGEAYEVNINSDGLNIPLADKGMGSIQAMLLILRLAVIIYKKQKEKKNYTVIIEEPELNLHPALQSKLADLFLDVHQRFNIDFLIETHSEYILRRSQVIVAENEFEVAPNENPFCVHYFPKDIHQMPYRLEYQEDGSFNRNFGDGFFDEASSSTLELLKLKRQKKA